MNQDVFGDVIAALGVARSQGKLGGYLGLPAPIVMAGKMKLPHALSLDSVDCTMVANQYYDFPILIERIETFAGAICCNRSTGGNGKKIKIALYDESANGGAGALLKNFGEITLDATQAIRQLASSWTPTRLGWHFLRVVSDTAPLVFGMSSTTRASNVGYYQRVLGCGAHGDFVALAPGGDTLGSPSAGGYVAGTYANFPESIAVATTTSISGFTAGTASNSPLVALYK